MNLKSVEGEVQSWLARQGRGQMPFFARLRKRSNAFKNKVLKKDEVRLSNKFNDWTSYVYQEVFIQFGTFVFELMSVVSLRL